MPSESRVQMTVKIPFELYNLMSKAVNEKKYQSMSAVVVIALEKEIQVQICSPDVILKNEKELHELTAKLQKYVSENAVLLANYQGVQRLIDDKEERTKELQEQLKVKDTQLEKITETMNAQAVHIQTLINQKQIEAPGAKRPWWRFW
jgi:Arc/MetJ-type ribon-helix-helix transcriptional regulator